MTNVFAKFRDAIGHGLQIAGGWIAKQEKSLAKVLHDVNPLMDQAEAFVRKLDDAVAKFQTLNPGVPGDVPSHVKDFLDTVVADGSKVQAFLAANANVPDHTLLENAVTLAIQNTPAGAQAKLNQIKTAVNLAVSVVRVNETDAVANEG